MKQTLDRLENYIFELETENARNMTLSKIREYINIVRSRKENNTMFTNITYTVPKKMWISEFKKSLSRFEWMQRYMSGLCGESRDSCLHTSQDSLLQSKD